VGGMKEEMRLLSINGVPFKDESFNHIMNTLHDLNPSMPIQLEMEVKKMKKAVEASNPEPMNVRIDCVPDEMGEEKCDVIFEVQLTLEPSMTRAVQWRKARSLDMRPVMVVESVEEGSEAFSRGMRPGMVVKTMVGGSGRRTDEVVNMESLRGINMRNFQDFFRLARYPITFKMLENVKLGSEDNEDLIAFKDKRIARAHAKRREIEMVDERRIEDGRDFPLMGALMTATMLPSSVILALNFAFGWYTGDMH